MIEDIGFDGRIITIRYRCGDKEESLVYDTKKGVLIDG